MRFLVNEPRHEGSHLRTTACILYVAIEDLNISMLFYVHADNLRQEVVCTDTK